MYIPQKLEKRNEIPYMRAFRSSVDIPEKVHDCIAFTEFCRELRKMAANVHGKNTQKTLFPKSSQRLYPNWEQEAWDVWQDFGDNAAGEILQILHSRKELGISDRGYTFSLNANSIEFTRDTNLSISVHNSEGREIAIVGFFISPGKTIEVFQIQGRRKYGIGEEDFGELLKELIFFVKPLGFSRIVIVRSAKNYLSTKPNHTKDFKSKKEEDVWLIKHRERMAITYDANPVRKWGFKSPEKKEDRRFFSAEYIF